MSHENLQSKTMRPWLTLAVFAPLAHYSGGSWPVLLVLTLLAAGMTGLISVDGKKLFENKFLCLAELCWLLLLSAHYLPLSARYWPGEKSDLVIPAVILLLAAYSCKARADRTAGVLCWLFLLLLLPLCFAALEDGKKEWIFPGRYDCNLWVIPVLLLPALSSCLKGEKEKCNTGWILYLPAILVWCATSAVLSPKIAPGLQTPFRELSGALTVGAGSRFESVAAVLITLGWYAFASFLLSVSVKFMEALGIKKTLAPWLAAAVSIVLCWMNVQQNPVFSSVLTLFLWLLVPMLHCKKISKKSEKSA